MPRGHFFAPVGCRRSRIQTSNLRHRRAAAELGLTYVRSTQAGLPDAKTSPTANSDDSRSSTSYYSAHDDELVDLLPAPYQGRRLRHLVVTLDTTLLGCAAST